MARVIIELKDATDSAIYLRTCANIIRKQILKRGDTSRGEGKKFCETLDTMAEKLLIALPPTMLEEAMKNYNPPAEKVQA